MSSIFSGNKVSAKILYFVIFFFDILKKGHIFVTNV